MTYLRRIAFAFALCAATSFGCADTGEQGALDAGAGADAGVTLDGSGEASAIVNACGGTVALTRAPGAPCGDCLDGQWVCDGDDALACHGATRERNSCGTCEPLVGQAGDACGCDGVRQCDGPRLVCVDDTPRNACGGCAPLENGVVGQSCDDDGVRVCAGPNATTCRSGDRNACGATGPTIPSGDLPDDARPGTPCGACGRGAAQCAAIGESELICADGDVGLNACGGCAPLRAEPGQSCGCGGTGAWVCDSAAAGGVRCDGAQAPNACGGCEALDAAPGAACPAGRWACSGPDDLTCVSDDAPACGAEAVGRFAPAEPCGPCGDGLGICTSPGTSSCAGASEPNACGGCGRLAGEPGEFCAAGRVWTCDDGQVRCVETRERNACGGVSRLGAAPGDRCGACGDGLYVCISEEDVACLGGGTPNACGGCSELAGVVGRPCGICNTGRWACDGPEGVRCEGEDPNAEFDSYADFDEDGFGDPDVTARVCPGTPGYVRTRGDCDDTSATSYPGAAERCDERDNDCDGSIDEDFVRWVDSDGDGFGAPGTERVICTETSGFVDDDSDCYDDSPLVFPAQTLTFDEDRGDGSFDYDCSGTEDLQVPDAGRCGTPPLTCNFVPNGYRRGWVDGPVPDCGEEGRFLFDCLPSDEGCEQRSEVRVQLCR